MGVHSPFALFDLAPLAQLVLLAFCLALVPLAWVAWRYRRTLAPRRAQALTVLTLFLTFDLVMFGAFTRLTDSGLGCPDWPGCYAQVSPLQANAHITIAENSMPTGPVTLNKAWIEMLHRYLAGGVGMLCVVLAAMSWWARGRKGKVPTIGPLWPTLTLIWVLVQGAFGAFTVTMKLFPAIVTLHLVGGLILLAMLCIQVVRWRLLDERAAMYGVPASLRAVTAVVFFGLAVQIALGGWVSTNYAVLACSDFPQCQGSWWPPMNFAQGFEVWRNLGLTAAGVPISFDALTAIHYVHRLMAVVVLAGLAALAWQLHRVEPYRRAARWLAALLTLQLGTGLSNVVLGWPLLGAVLHTGGAAALAGVLTWVIAMQRAAAFSVPASAIQFGGSRQAT